MAASDAVGCYGWDEGDGYSLMDIDREGRAVLTQHNVEGLDGSALVVVNVYCPHVEVEHEDRQQFKLNFYYALQNRVVALQRAGKWVGQEWEYTYMCDLCCFPCKPCLPTRAVLWWWLGTSTAATVPLTVPMLWMTQ